MNRLILRREQSFQGPLILVNQDHPLRENVPPALASLDPLYPNVLMERRACRLLSACIQAAKGQGSIVPVSGWRSFQEQQDIWNDTWAKEGETFTRRYVARPGCSEHQTGLAMDLGQAAPCIDFIRPNFPEDGPCGTFRRLAAQYGFVQRYRREKESLTHIAEEPWHFRYVGVPHAQLMVQHHLCLEEYIPFLRSGVKEYRLSNGRTAQVSWISCSGEVTEVEVPQSCWQLSGDNQGGFVLTVWEGEL